MSALFITPKLLTHRRIYTAYKTNKGGPPAITGGPFIKVKIMQEIKETVKDNLSQILQLVSFNIGEEQYGVDILKVHEIIRMVTITQVPDSPSYMEGIINLRGKIIPIVDLRLRMGIAKKEYDKGTRVIIVDISGKVMGFIVDSVNEVLRIPKSITEPPPTMTTQIDSDFITSIAKMENNIVILLNLEKILSI